MPALQLLQLPEPPALMDPVGQTVQFPALAPANVPAGQAAHGVAAPLEYWPAPQGVQSGPAVAEKRPEGQLTHAAAPAALY